MSRSPGPRGTRRERGAALIEFAIMVPLLFTLVFGIIDFGFAFNDFIQVRQGSREATRQAVSARVGNDTSCTITAPAPTNTMVRKVICLAKDRVDLPDDRIRVKLNVEENYADRKSLQVCVMVKLKSVTGFFGSVLDNKVVQSGVQMRIEQTTDDVAGADVEDLIDYTEPAFTGHSYSCVLSTTV